MFQMCVNSTLAFNFQWLSPKSIPSLTHIPHANKGRFGWCIRIQLEHLVNKPAHPS
jgi:hypothetical protein